jgi:hypothetical protein
LQPFEVICSPYTLYAATVGTAFPNIDTAPVTGTGGWTQIGTSGNKNYTDTGVTVTHTQTVSTFTPAGSTTVRKAWRTEEGLTVAFELADLSPAQYALMLDNVPVTVVAPSTAEGGYSQFELMRGVQVNQYSLLVRGISPINEAYTAQYQVSSAFMMGNPAPRYSKQGPATLAVEFHAYELTPGHLATWVAQASTHS